MSLKIEQSYKSNEDNGIENALEGETTSESMDILRNSGDIASNYGVSLIKKDMKSKKDEERERGMGGNINSSSIPGKNYFCIDTVMGESQREGLKKPRSLKRVFFRKGCVTI